MNWGGFAGGFAQGLNQTFDSKGIARYLMSPERRQEQILAEGMAEAKAARDTDVGNMIQSNGITQSQQPSAMDNKPAQATPTVQTAEAPQEATTPSTPAPEANAGSGIKAIVADQQAPAAEAATPAAGGLPYTVKGKGYATMDEARAAAEKQTPSVMDYMYKTAFPKMQEAYIASGNMEAAERLQKYIESKRGSEAVASYGKAMNKLMFTSDVDGGVKALGDYYTKYVDDGVDFVKGEVGQDGKINITTKNKQDGSENVMSLSKGDVLRMGMAFNPGKLLEMNLVRADEAEKAQAKNRADIAKEDRQFDRDIQKMTIEKQLDAANVTGKERRALNAKIEALRGAGYSQDFINGALPGLLGIGDYKKGTSPEEARRLAHSDRMKNDPMYSRKPADQQAKILDQDMAIIYAGGKPTSTTGVNAPATPAAGGLPKAGGNGVPVFDTKTGQIIYK